MKSKAMKRAKLDAKYTPAELLERKRLRRMIRKGLLPRYTIVRAPWFDKRGRVRGTELRLHDTIAALMNK